jgi:hypothetical protein
VIQPLKARVENGRLVLDVPTDLPDGTEVEVVLVNAEFDPEERARLIQAIEDGESDIERGDHVDGFEFVARLRAKREAANR